MLSFIGMLCRVSRCAARGKDGPESPAEKSTKERAVAPPAPQARSDSGDPGPRSEHPQKPADDVLKVRVQGGMRAQRVAKEKPRARGGA